MTNHDLFKTLSKSFFFLLLILLGPVTDSEAQGTDLMARDSSNNFLKILNDAETFTLRRINDEVDYYSNCKYAYEIAYSPHNVIQEKEVKNSRHFWLGGGVVAVQDKMNHSLYHFRSINNEKVKLRNSCQYGYMSNLAQNSLNSIEQKWNAVQAICCNPASPDNWYALDDVMNR